MKKYLVILLSLFAFSAFAGNGRLYFKNANNVYNSPNLVQFKFVLRNDDQQIIKSFTTEKVKPASTHSFDLKKGFSAIKKGTVDVYIKDATKTGKKYEKCEEGFPYFEGVMIVVQGWSTPENATCHIEG